ncbi:YtzC family protein [Bacillus sp. FJAT-47783]|uniref:YtzC family protein n=1 Tax=Bacillus sp. FJAT-47783 TaxID=2922712 RepID=UPI001FABDA7A|nr:YtzC family protein [Bacillus sp. FJAT-47783]
MATRQSVENCIQKCEEVLNYAREQYEEAAKQEHYNDEEYTKAQRMLEEVLQEIAQLEISSSDQQREQLYRERLKLQSLQNNMILQ